MDKNQFEALFRSEFRKLCSFAIRYTHDLDAAKELVQDSFVKLWEKKEHLDVNQNVKTYLSTIVRNRCLNYIRDNRKFINETANAEFYFREINYQPPDRVQESEISKRIGEAIGELPEKCREVFTLNRFENMKYQEIAVKLEISVKTVETQMSKALQHLRVRLAEFLALLILILPGWWH